MWVCVCVCVCVRCACVCMSRAQPPLLLMSSARSSYVRTTWDWRKDVTETDGIFAYVITKATMAKMMPRPIPTEKQGSERECEVVRVVRGSER